MYTGNFGQVLICLRIFRFNDEESCASFDNFEQKTLQGLKVFSKSRKLFGYMVLRQAQALGWNARFFVFILDTKPHSTSWHKQKENNLGHSSHLW